MVYGANAEVDKVKHILDGFMIAESLGRIKGKVNDGNGWVWDEDGGKKTAPCPVFGESPHTRLYADGDDRMFNVDWGYYVLATTHKDVRECGRNTQFGWSEDAVNWVSGKLRAKGIGVTEDWSDFRNAERDRWEKNHFWRNNGRATWVHIP